MMKRPWQVWLVLLSCIVAAFGAMAWLTQEALQSDRARRAALAATAQQQQISLALWRMDTKLAPWIATEIARPVTAYRVSSIDGQQAQARILRADPLPPHVLLRFEVRPDGTWYSPQVPLARDRLAELENATSFASLQNLLPDTPVPIPHESTGQQLASTVFDTSTMGPPAEDSFPYFAGNSVRAVQDLTPADISDGKRASSKKSATKATQSSQVVDFQRRNLQYQSLAEQNWRDALQQSQVIGPAESQSPVEVPAGNSVPEGPISISHPVWVGDHLLLARRVGLGSESVVQGSCLDWTSLKVELLRETNDLLPSADLVPVASDPIEPWNQVLAGLPVQLVVPEPQLPEDVDRQLVRSLWMGWGAVMLAASAAVVLLQGVMSLSERRAAFVSSVTHELRTPLTTFRLYADMLARGMVAEPQRRQDYLETLREESQRLTLLVENVLAYAGLERGRSPRIRDRVSCGELLERLRPAIDERAARAGLSCQWKIDADVIIKTVITDVGAVEQILLNLVDNAAKYASSKGGGSLELGVRCVSARWLAIAVVDHGPGIPLRFRSGWIRPFFKSAQQSAETQSGVGLGLNLCRRLARQLGGKLMLSVTPGGGATAEMWLPVD